jgi:copper transport protein
MTSLRAVLLVAVLAVAGVGVLASPADAHALLERSSPAAGASLPRAPHLLLLFFTEAPDPSLSTVSLLNSAGRTVRGTGKPAAAPGDAQELRVTLPRLTRGVYTVNWRTVSKVDGHITNGSFAFGIGARPPSGAAAAQAANTGSASAAPGLAAVAGRWLLYWGLALLAAAGATGALVFDWRLPGRAGMVIAAGWLYAAIGVLVMILAEQAAAEVPFGELFRATAGRSLLAQAAAVAVCGVAAFCAARRPAGPRLAVLGAAAAAALFVHAQAGHAEAQSSVRLFNVADQWLHMLGAAVWVGGLVWLLLGLRGLRGVQRASAVRRFSQLAFAAVALIAATGVLRAVPEVGSPGALVSTSFGFALLVKTALFVGLMGVAWRNRYRLVPRIASSTPVAPGALPPLTGGGSADPPGREEAGTGSRPGGADALPPELAGGLAIRLLRRSIRSEVTLAAIVLVVAAVLSGLPPASYVEAAARQKSTSPSITVTGSDFATTARVRLTASPGTVGSNRFTVQVLRYDTGTPIPARSVRLEFSLLSNPNVASGLNLARGAGGTWTGQGTNLSIGGQWQIDVVIQEAATAVDTSLRLHTRAPA